MHDYNDAHVTLARYLFACLSAYPTNFDAA